MPKAPPSFDSFYNDWFAGTAHLDHVARDCFLSLLIYQWQNGEIPKEPLLRMNLCRIIDVGQWERIWRHIEDKFECFNETGGLRNGKLHELRKKAIDRWERAKKNGAKGGRPKKTGPNTQKTRKKLLLLLKTQGLFLG